ncbi:MAG: arginase family protein [Solirubrobacteraceae bacterium]
MTTTLRRAVRETIVAGQRPLLLGGCGTLEIGAVAGARDALGRVGIVSIDGHVDACDHRSSPTGGRRATAAIAASCDRSVPTIGTDR